LRRGIPRGRSLAQAVTKPAQRSTPPILPRRRPLARIWAVVSPALVGGTAAVTLLASATIMPSFATTRPTTQESSAPATNRPAELESVVTRLSAQRQDRLSADASAIGSTQQGILLARHHNRARTSAAAVQTEISRLRNLSTFLWPTEGDVSSGFGYRIHPILRTLKLHNGADIGGACNNPIYAAQSGKVVKTSTGYSGGSGNNVRVDHGTIDGRNIQTAYLHMTRFIVQVGQRVTKGDLIGYVGSTGLSTACHLHLTLYKDGVGSDPLEYVKR
jgi:murein DD-endopeptidase MepM/ murein hydrolase activator NlpD